MILLYTVVFERFLSKTSAIKSLVWPREPTTSKCYRILYTNLLTSSDQVPFLLRYTIKSIIVFTNLLFSTIFSLARIRRMICSLANPIITGLSARWMKSIRVAYPIDSVITVLTYSLF
jgi:hypothetical protein